MTGLALYHPTPYILIASASISGLAGRAEVPPMTAGEALDGNPGPGLVWWEDAQVRYFEL